MKSVLLLVALLFAGAFAQNTFKYAGVLKSATQSLAPTFDSTGVCTTGTATTESIYFTVNITTPQTYFVQAMFEKSIVSGATVRILTAANTAAAPCTGLVRGGTSSSGKAPHAHFLVTFTSAGMYYVYIQSSAAVAADKDGIFAIHMYPATAAANTANSQSIWELPSSYSRIAGSGVAADCTSGGGSGNTATYATFNWGRPAVSGWYDAYIIYETGNASSSSAGLALYSSDTNVLPTNFGNSTFDVCTNSSTTLLLGYGQTDDGLDMGLTYGELAILYRFWASNNTYYYFAMGSTYQDTVGLIALRVESTRFSTLDTLDSATFMQPALSVDTCSDGALTHYGPFTFTPEDGQYVFVVDTGVSEFDAVGHLYAGNNSGSPPLTCPPGWVMSVDLGDVSPLATYPLQPGQLYTAVVGKYNGGGTAGALFQLWALGGSYLGPAVSFPMAPTTPTPGGNTPVPGTSTPSSAAHLALSVLAIIAAILALLF